MDAKLITDLTTGQTSGVIGGISVGDAKADVKSKAKKGWELEETSESLVYSKIWGDFNFAKLTFHLNSNNQVHSMALAVTGEGENQMLLANLNRELKSELDVKFEAMSKNKWSYNAPNGNSCFISLNMDEEKADNRTRLYMNVVNSGPLN